MPAKNMKFLKSKLYGAMLQSGIYFCFIVAAQQASLAHGISIQGAVPPVHAGVHNGQCFHTQNGINNVHNAAVGSGSTSPSGANVNHHLFHTHNDGINNVHNASVRSGSTSALGANVNHHHHHANILAPVDLKKAGEFADYFGLKPGVSNTAVSNFAGQHLNSAVNASNFTGQHLNSAVNANNFVHTHLNNNINVPIGSQTNKQSSQSLLAHVSRFDHEKEAVQVLAQAARNGENLNLASGKLSVTWESHSSVTIELGGSTKTIVYGERITPAELAAANQKLNESGNQTLVLNAQGEAVGGTLNLTATTMPYFNLVIPKGVEVNVIGSTLSHPLNVLGAVKDYGTLDFVSSKGSTGIADLNAGKLFVGSTGVITDLGTLDVSSKSLFNNEGMITAGTLNLNTGSGVFTNTGTITATTGNVTFTAPVAQNLVLNNTAGTIQANNGAINVRGSNYTGTANMTLSGGNYLSQTLNLNDGGGNLNVNVGQVTGLVNETALNAHTIVASSDLKLGDLKINGDPLFYNLTGDVNLTSMTYAGEPLAVVAGRNIIAPPTSTISTADNSISDPGAGYITMIAGAKFTVGSDGGVTVTGGDATGGYIHLGNLDASSTANSGGVVYLIAFPGSAANSGTVTFNSINVNGGPGGGMFGMVSDGNVYIYAGATSGTNSIGPSNGGTATITATGSINGSGNVVLATATPWIFSPYITIDSSGNLINQYVLPAAVQTPGITNISITASASITLDTSVATNMNLVISPQYSYGSGPSPITGILVNTSVTGFDFGQNDPGWTGPFTFTGSMNSGQNQIQIFNYGGQNISLSGGTFTSAYGIAVMTLPNSTFNTSLTFTGPVSNYGVWVNGTQEGSNINVASGQTQTLSYAANTGAGTDSSPVPLAVETINTGSTSSSFGPGITGFTFGPGAPSISLSSLDLSNATVKTDIATLIANGTPGISGSATALVLSSSVSSLLVNLGSLSALDIPQGDSITFTGFTNSGPIIGVNLTSGSSTTQALINGTLSFTNSNASVGQLTISSTQTGPALVIGSTGILSSDHQLVIIAPTIQNNGVVSASNSLSASSNAGSMTGSGSFKSPTMNLTAVGGNIGANAGATTALLVNSGGTSGMNLSVLATQVSGSGGVVNISDANAEGVVLSNASSPSSAAVSFALAANGNISANTAGNTAISSPVIALTATGGNIAANTGGTTALLVNSGGTGGINLSTVGNAINLSDTSAEAVNLGTNTANANFTLGAHGNVTVGNSVGSSSCTAVSLTTTGSNFIEDAGSGSYGVTASAVTLVTPSGQIGTPGFRVNCTSLAVNTTGNVHVSNSGTATLAINASSGNSLAITSNGTMDINGNVTGSTSVTLQTAAGSNGNIIIAANVGTYGANTTTTLVTDGSGKIADAALEQMWCKHIC